MQLAHTRLADPQHLTDFLQIQFFVVIQRQHQLFTLGQVGDGVGQRLLKTFILEITERLRVETGSVFLELAMIAFLQQIVEAEQATAQRIAQNAVILVET